MANENNCYQDLLVQIQVHNEAYYNGEPLVTDEEYDRLVAEYTELTGSTPSTGVLPSADKTRVSLPVYMGGTNKFKYTDDPRILTRFTTGTENFLVTEKLDGTAAVVKIPPRGAIKAYTRGDYSTGFEITELFQKKAKGWRRWKSTVYVRGELIMSKDVFREKYSQDFSNSRSLVNGVVNAKTRDPSVVNDIHFIAFEIMVDSRGLFSEQMAKLESHGFSTPLYEEISQEKITVEYLQQIYERYSTQQSMYTLDGLVVYKNSDPMALCTDRNPSFSLAYKPPTISTAVTVESVQWEISRYNKLKPVAVFSTVVLADSNVTHATAHNARFVTENGIGPGAEIEITKSNEVIPYIVRVITPSNPAVPDVDYEWCGNRVDYMFTGVNSTVLVKQITHFLKSCGVKGISERTVEKVVESGVSDILSFLCVTDETLADLEGFQTRKIQGFRKSLSVLKSGVNLSDVMAGSPDFPHGFGKRKFAAITAEIPDILDLFKNSQNREILQNRLAGTHGISQKSAIQIIGGLEQFTRFVSAATGCGALVITFPRVAVESRTNVEEPVLSGSYVFSGFRDSELETRIQNLGGKVTGSVTKKTTAVIVKDLSKESSKTRRAQELNIPIETRDVFMGNL